VIWLFLDKAPEWDPSPPVKGKNKDNVEDKGVPLLYIGLQFIFVDTWKLGFVIFVIKKN
jgi:hypothetical protein